MGVAYHQLGRVPAGHREVLRRRPPSGSASATSAGWPRASRTGPACTWPWAASPRRSPTCARRASIYEKIGDRTGLADVLNDFGVLHEGRGDYARARRPTRRRCKIRRDLGDERQLAQSYDNVGYIFFLEGEYDNALVYWQQALDRRRKIGEKGGIVLSMQNLGLPADRPGPLGRRR